MSTNEQRNTRLARQFGWIFCGVFIGLFALSALVGYLAIKLIFPEPPIYLEVKKVAGPVYEPNPRPYAKKVITPEIREKAEFEVIEEITL